MPFSEAELSTIQVLLWGSGMAAVAWLAKTLTSEQKLHARNLIGGTLAAAVAAFSFGAIVGETVQLRNTYIIGVSGIVGFIGGDALELMARQLRKRLERDDDTPRGGTGD